MALGLQHRRDKTPLVETGLSCPASPPGPARWGFQHRSCWTRCSLALKFSRDVPRKTTHLT